MELICDWHRNLVSRGSGLTDNDATVTGIQAFPLSLHCAWASTPSSLTVRWVLELRPLSPLRDTLRHARSACKLSTGPHPADIFFSSFFLIVSNHESCKLKLQSFYIKAEAESRAWKAGRTEEGQ